MTTNLVYMKTCVEEATIQFGINTELINLKIKLNQFETVFKLD